MRKLISSVAFGKSLLPPTLVAATFALAIAGCPSNNSVRDSGDAGLGLGDIQVTTDNGSDEDVDITEPDIDEPMDIDEVMDTDMVDVNDTSDAVPPPPDVVLDAGPDIVDAGPDVEEFPPPNGVPQFANCSAPGGDRNIYDLQDPQCPDHVPNAPTSSPGVDVTLTGVIVTAVLGDTTFVQEPAGGPYSGIAIFTHGIPAGEVAPGKILTIDGSYFEYFGASQIYLEEWTITGETEVPQPFIPSHPSHVATGGAMAEMMEGVLLRVFDLQTIHTKPDCPQEFGEFLVTGDLRIDDMGLFWDARLGDQFVSITGPLHYTFENFKLEPRNEEDFDVVKKGGEGSVSKCIEADCIVPDTAPTSGQVRVTEIMADPFDNDTGQEWIELHNTTNQAISIDGWEIRDCTGQTHVLAGAGTIPAGGYYVIGANGNPVTNGGVPVDFAYGDNFYLPNTVGSVLLFDGSGFQAQLVDQTRYSRFEPWEAFVTGRSMERKSPSNDGTKPESWVPGQAGYGSGDNKGTPGEANDAF